MAERADAGELVVRLKGGDPFVFGRGAEEAAALLDAGVDFTVTPGVSSALAGPAAAGIPVTHRETSRSITIVTGHEAEGTDPVRWARLATGADTLVILMGSGRLARICAALVAAGRPSQTPAAVVAEATTPRQRAVFDAGGDRGGGPAGAGLAPRAAGRRRGGGAGGHAGVTARGAARHRLE